MPCDVKIRFKLFFALGKTVWIKAKATCFRTPRHLGKGKKRQEKGKERLDRVAQNKKKQQHEDGWVRVVAVAVAVVVTTGGQSRKLVGSGNWLHPVFIRLP